MALFKLFGKERVDKKMCIVRRCFAQDAFC